MKHGNNSIHIKWDDIEHIDLKNSLKPAKIQSIFSIIDHSKQNDQFIDIKLKALPEFELILPWFDEMNLNIPNGIM